MFPSAKMKVNGSTFFHALWLLATFTHLWYAQWEQTSKSNLECNLYLLPMSPVPKHEHTSWHKGTPSHRFPGIYFWVGFSDSTVIPCPWAKDNCTIWETVVNVHMYIQVQPVSINPIVMSMWISDRINWIISKRSTLIFSRITSNQSIYDDE